MHSVKESPEDPQEGLKVLQEKFYKTLENFFSGGTMDNTLLGFMEGLNENLKKTNKSIEGLDKTIQKADESSRKLTKALNIITSVGVIIAVITLIIALF